MTIRLVIDTNVLLAGLLRDSVTRSFIVDPLIELYAPEYLVEEIEGQLLSSTRYRKRLEKAPGQFPLTLSMLFAMVETVPFLHYAEEFRRALTLAPHQEDAHYLGLALRLNLPVWSNDAGMKEQNEVQVVTTEELTRL